MEMEENGDDGHDGDGETAGEADAPALASTAAPALTIALPDMKMEEFGPAISPSSKSFMTLCPQSTHLF